MLPKLIILTFICGIVYSEKVRYDDYALYKVYPQDAGHIKFLSKLQQDSDGLDFWKPPNRIGEFVSIVSSPAEKVKLEHALSKRSINYEVMLEDLQQAIDDQIFSRKRRDTGPQMFWTNYQTMDDIYEWFEYLAKEYSDVVSLIHAGESFEGRNITGVRISRGNSQRAVFVEGGQIAADWLSPTVITYLVDQLVRGDDLDAKRATEDFEWHIFPILNPDGHEFTQNSDRLWLKNRRPTMGTAIGVDLTKNWNSHWGIIGGSFTASANNYIGLGPFSEVETRAISRYLDGIGARLNGLLSFRGFGQRLLIPFAHTTSHMYNYNETVIVGRRAMGSLAVKYNTQYLVGTSSEVHDGATGSIADWVKHRFNPSMVVTYHLRDDGTWGYTLPVNQVLPSCMETFDSIMAIFREARNLDVL